MNSYLKFFFSYILNYYISLIGVGEVEICQTFQGKKKGLVIKYQNKN